MTAPSQAVGLSLEALGYLNYLRGLLAQPRGSWEGFYTPNSPSMNFALRYQLAFGAYAVAALARRTPAYRAPYAEALRGAIEKMLDVASWGYWRAPAQADAGAGTLDVGSQGNERARRPAPTTGHVAVLLSPHAQAQAGPPSDPIVRDNLQYSGHLSTMLGLYEKLTGDDRYDRPFTLADAQSGVGYTYTHGEVAGRIVEQMRGNSFGGVCCETGIAYVPCNNHALSSNALHDAVHGTKFSVANARWLRSVRRKMVLAGPAVRGIFGVCYLKDVGMAAPVAFNFTDAWGLAFMIPFDRPLVRKLYPKFRRRLTRTGADGAYLSSSPLNEKMEISDVAINTGFALIAARGMGDARTAADLGKYASGVFDAGWRGNAYLCRSAPRTAHSTALYALAEAIEPGGEGFAEMFRAPLERSTLDYPFLAAVESEGGRVGVTYARYDPSWRTLLIRLREVGDPTALRGAAPVEAVLTLGNIDATPRVEVGGEEVYPSPAPRFAHTPLSHKGRGGDTLSFSVRVDPLAELACEVKLPGS